MQSRAIWVHAQCLLDLSAEDMLANSVLCMRCELPIKDTADTTECVVTSCANRSGYYHTNCVSGSRKRKHFAREINVK